MATDVHGKPYRKGDAVEVYSASSQKWVRSTIEVVIEAAGVHDGYSCAAGTLKVVYDSGAGVKFILPDQVAVAVRRIPGAAPLASAPGSGGGYSFSSIPSTGTSSAGVTLCKFGCGFPVEAGLTRGMKKYDTCCKQCAGTKGKGGHSDTCSSRRASTRTARPTFDPKNSPKVRLEALMKDPAALRTLAAREFASKGLGAANLDRKQAESALNACLSADVKAPPADTLSKLFEQADANRDGALNQKEFEALVTITVKERLGKWFPRLNPLTTEAFVQQNKRKLLEEYRLGAQLGAGSFGTVFDAVHIASLEARVCKKLPKASTDVPLALQEIHSMAMLDHPGVIKVFEFFEDAENIHQIMEPCKGGELDALVQEVRKSKLMDISSWPYRRKEDSIRDIMKQTLRAIAFMHSKKVIHKDLKPQNVMLVDTDSDSIKIIDFGLAELLATSDSHATQCGGTWLFMAPEAFQRKMGPKVDVWSAGVILYNMLTGDYPFMAEWKPPPQTDPSYNAYVERWSQQTQKVVQREPPNTKHHRLRIATPACLEACWQMLVKSVDDRPDAGTCGEMPWFHASDEETPTLSVGIIQCLEGFSRMPQLKKAIFLLIAHQCSVEATPELQAIFTHFDVSNQGRLNVDDLCKVLVRAGMQPLFAQSVAHALDLMQTGKIGWTSFLAASTWYTMQKRVPAIEAAYRRFDPTGRGSITKDDILRVLTIESSRKAWQTHLEDEQAILKLVSSVRGSEGNATQITKEDFVCYIKQQEKLVAGDALLSV
eukprot:TRINITY_DN91625_c0_g1_i1.p1 TRINITY_DN91625_c0_g1~~TRINITY_DN91625_c0_g1_i1.p1  ORF type:complete len:769 (+),score=115.15 TRINITY_DN91625_c0_g1_i1:183-2489(+)